MITYRVLEGRDLAHYATFLKQRSIDSLVMYFGYAVNHEHIDRLIVTMMDKPELHYVLLAEDDNFEPVATVHMAQMNKHEMEFGFMVAEPYRKQGIASGMMDFAMTWCRNRGFNDIFMHCLSYNAPIKHLVRKHGLEISSEGTEADARVTLPRTNIFSIGHEMFMRQQNIVNTNIKHHIQSFRRALV